MTTSQLPAHLQKFQAPDVGAALSANLGSAMPPHVSIEGGRFKLIDASNNEIPVPTFDPQIGVYLDAVIIDVNAHMSRMYYIRDYDPSAAGAPPDCWSDNGVAASIGATSVPLLQPPHPRAGQPAATCAECPMAVWGSKTSNLGSKIPACSQKQKTALLVPGFQTLFLLAIPPNSHKYLREYVERSRGSGVNMADVITRISFVAGVQGTLQFSPVNYIDEPTAILRQAAYAEKKTDALVGRNDVPRSGTAQIVQQNTVGMTNGQAARLEQQLQAPAQQVQPQTFVQPAATVPNMLAGVGDLNQPMPASQIAMQPVPATFGQFTQTAPAQQVQQPAPFVSLTLQGTPNVTSATPNSSFAGQLPVLPATSSEPAATPRRRRRTAAEMQAAQPGQQAPAAAQTAPQQQAPASPGQMPQAPFPHPGQAAPQTPFPASQQPSALPGQTDMGFGMATGTPAAANPEVSAMLDNFFKQG